MTKIQRIHFAAAAAALLLATALGAYGTHGLRGSLAPGAWESFSTAVDYQFYHGLGLLGTTLVSVRQPESRLISIAGWLLLAGIVLFCGSLYATALGAPAFGSLAPTGGTAFMLGWLVFGIGVLRART
jgi:uncharacterized membrane protein YgdD (TMEM256/DUF423 family)